MKQLQVIAKSSGPPQETAKRVRDWLMEVQDAINEAERARLATELHYSVTHSPDGPIHSVLLVTW